MRWNKEEIELLVIWVEQGLTYKEIGNELDRTEASVKGKSYLLGLKSLNSIRKTIDIFKQELFKINSKINITSTTYINNNTKLTCMCKMDGHIWQATPHNLLNGTGCPKCGGKRQKTNEQFIVELKQVNKNIIVLDKYINAKTKVKLKCLLDNNVWYATPHKLIQGYGCPLCANKNKSGYYGTLTKEQADALDYPLYLYHVTLRFEEEMFNKYGLSKHKDRRRFKEYNPYKLIKEISFEKYDAWTAICKEKELKSNYTPKHHFSGWTECYKQ